MKKKVSLLFFALMSAFAVYAAPVFNAPAIRLQPNGDTLHCLLSGDEYYHRLHDADGYTIVQNPRTGFWVYADSVHTSEGRWQVVATNYVAGISNPHLAGINPNIGLDYADWQKRQHRFDIPQQNQPKANAKTSGRNHGTLNNIVIFVRFSDDAEISTSLSSIDAMFNDSTAGAYSMYNYFKTVSYNKLHIPTHYYPTPNGNSIVSYQDSLPRSYYMPYDATTNPTGYSDDDERRNREFGLLQRAIDYVNTNSPISSATNLDMDNDGMVDNICFVVKGTYTGWSDLLWPHKWAIYDRYVYINGKRVYTFNLQLEGSGAHYFSSSTFCHEMFHTLGAPDLYRYEVATQVSGVGSWDLMCNNTTPPQTMGAYMKWKYGNWIDSIPEIRAEGSYTLHSLGDSSYANIAYKIRGDHPNQWYVLEYRDNTEQFETTLPGKGLLIYRIDDRFWGNANFDGYSSFDEVYLFRPGGDNDTTNGYPAQAFFSGNTTRTAFGPSTDPRPWLNINREDTTLSISDIGIPGETITFTYNDLRGCMKPSELVVDSTGSTAAKLRWEGQADRYIVRYGNGLGYNHDTCYSNTVIINNLDINTHYYWQVKSQCGDGTESTYSELMDFETASCYDLQNVVVGTGTSLDKTVPFNSNSRHSYVQSIYKSDEIGVAMSIEKIAFGYASSNELYLYDCEIYMANTAKEQYTSTTTQNLVQYGQLQLVYSGPIRCIEGWNEIRLDTPFQYNGHDNLVIAVLDKSSQISNDGYFYCTQTPNRYSTVIYSHSSYIDITASTINCQKIRKQFQANVRLTGCADEGAVTISVTTDGEGQTTGAGSYNAGDECTLSATAERHWHFVAWTEGSDTIGENPYVFTVDSSRTLTAHFEKDKHRIIVESDPASAEYGRAWFTVPGYCGPSEERMLDYGTEVILYAEPYDSAAALFDHWSDGSAEMPHSIILKSDTTFVAYFSQRPIGIEAAEGDSVSIAVEWRQVAVGGGAGQTIEILDITGRSIVRRRSSGEETFTVPAAGVYIIRIGDLQPQKVVVK